MPKWPSYRIYLALLAALVLGSFFPQISAPLRAPFIAGNAPPAESTPLAKGVESSLRLSDGQIEAAGVSTMPIEAGALRRKITVPATITPDPGLVARVAAKVAGTVAEMRNKLGDPVQKGEIIAVLESREVADAKSEYLAAATNYELQNALFVREKGLFEKKITAEQLFLRARTVYIEAKLRLDLARQKLTALDLSDGEIAALSRPTGVTLNRKEIRAPISGRISERLVSIGQPVGGEGQAKELYVVSDLSSVEADLAVPVADLPLVREKQSVSVTNAEGREVEGVVIYVSAMLTPETRAGHVIAAFANRDYALRPGSVLNARVVLAESPVKAKVPLAAIQSIGNENVVFVRTRDGFEKRPVEVGGADDEFVEILSGAKVGDIVAVRNSFVLKAELGKKDIPEE